MNSAIRSTCLLAILALTFSTAIARAEWCAEVRYTNNAGGYGFALKNFPDSQSTEASNWAPAGLTWSSYNQDAWLTARYLRAGWCDQQVDDSCWQYQSVCGGDMRTFRMSFSTECEFRNYMYAEAFTENVEYTSGFYYASTCN